MYAVFEDDKFIKIIPDAETHKYEVNANYILYKINCKGHMFSAKVYHCSLDTKGELALYVTAEFAEHLFQEMKDSIKEGIKLGDAKCKISFKAMSFYQKIRFLFKKDI